MKEVPDKQPRKFFPWHHHCSAKFCVNYCLEGKDHGKSIHQTVLPFLELANYFLEPIRKKKINPEIYSCRTVEQQLEKVQSQYESEIQHKLWATRGYHHASQAMH